MSLPPKVTFAIYSALCVLRTLIEWEVSRALRDEARSKGVRTRMSRFTACTEEKSAKRERYAKDVHIRERASKGTWK